MQIGVKKFDNCPAAANVSPGLELEPTGKYGPERLAVV
jgi:hypothetical protein